MHNHYCDEYGHEYECAEDCECICGLPMNGCDHSDCPIELRPCPEHKAEWERCLAETRSSAMQTKMKQDASPLRNCECGCEDIDGSMIVGWCLHCSHVYTIYTPEIQDQHFAKHCPAAPETLKKSSRARLRRKQISQ